MDASIVQKAAIELQEGGVNGIPYNHTTPTLTAEAGRVQEWSLSSEGAPLPNERNLLHPFHLHVYHMQAIDCPNYEDGEFYDGIVFCFFGFRCGLMRVGPQGPGPPWFAWFARVLPCTHSALHACCLARSSDGLSSNGIKTLHFMKSSTQRAMFGLIWEHHPTRDELFCIATS
jgi:hypothetical protein